MTLEYYKTTLKKYMTLEYYKAQINSVPKRHRILLL